MTSTDSVRRVNRSENLPLGKRAQLRHDIIISLLVFHAGSIFAPFTFSMSGLLIALLLWFLTGCLGVTLCFHRLLTHASFSTTRGVRYVLTVLGCLANEGPPIIWVGTHRLHHKHADRAGDPHSPVENFAWGHIVWAFFHAHEEDRRAAADLSRDPVMRRIDKFHFIPTLALAIVLGGLGGWNWVVWGICVRTVFVLHCTWLVNSASHRWGYRTFNTPDNSRNNWWVSMLTFGEGWHNNHHAQQRSAAHGMRWWEIDITYLAILGAERLGIVWNVRRPRQTGTGGEV